jgi:hypothetical protein
MNKLSPASTCPPLEIVGGGVRDGVTINNILIQGTEYPLYVRLAIAEVATHIRLKLLIPARAETPRSK